jgi:hypothetical protein
MKRTLQFRIDDPNVAELQKWLGRRIFAVPQLQREFVWNGKKAAKLFDSIYRGLTIGTLLVWETNSENSDWLRQELHLLPPFNRANDRVWYLIDGQQRLTVLYQAALGDVKKNSNGREVNFRHIVFALDPYDRDEDALAYRRPVEGRYVPVSDILSRHWRHLFNKCSQAKKERIKRCREMLLRYRVPILFVNTKNIEDVRETFLRINSGGTRVTAADEAFARASRFNLRAHVHTLRHTLPGFEDLDPNAILQGFSFVHGKRDVGKKVTQVTVREWETKIRENDRSRTEFDRIWDDYSDAVQKAVNFLRQEFSVYNLDFLPSENMLAVLPFFYYQNGAQPAAAQRAELRKWFWSTATGNRYSGRGHRKNMVADVHFLERLVKHRYSHFPPVERASVSEIIRVQYNTNTSLGKAFFCLLASRKPKRLLAEGEIPVDVVAGRADQKNKHHIFPKDLLLRHKFTAWEYNSLSNICFLPAEENQSIGKQPPHGYLGQLRRTYGFPAKVNSHLIPHKSGSAVWVHDVKKAFRQFRKERAAEIRKAFKDAAGIDLFHDER